jgi:hypothetical protein
MVKKELLKQMGVVVAEEAKRKQAVIDAHIVKTLIGLANEVKRLEQLWLEADINFKEAKALSEDDFLQKYPMKFSDRLCYSGSVCLGEGIYIPPNRY